MKSYQGTWINSIGKNNYPVPEKYIQQKNRKKLVLVDKTSQTKIVVRKKHNKQTSRQEKANKTKKKYKVGTLVRKDGDTR